MAELAARSDGALGGGSLGTIDSSMILDARSSDLPEPVNPWKKDLWTGVSSSGSGVSPVRD